MELRTQGGELRLGGAFKLVAIGYFLGAAVIFVPLFLLVALISLAAGAPATVNGQEVEGGGNVLLAVLPMIFMLPVVLAFQSFMFGGLAVLGLWLYQKRRPIRVIES